MATGSAKKKQHVSKMDINSKKASAPAVTATTTAVRRRWLSPPQFSFLLFGYVWISAAVHIGLRKGAVCVDYFVITDDTTAGDNVAAAAEEWMCQESELFLFLQYRQAIIVTVVFVCAMTLLCWQNDPLHQRMNLFLAQGLGATLLAIVSQGDVLHRKQRLRMFLSTFALVGTIFLGVRSAGIQVSRPFHKKSPTNVWILLITSVNMCGLLYYLIRGVKMFTTTTHETTITNQGQLIFYLTIAQHFTRLILLPIFAVVYLDDIRKKVTLLFIALANIYQFLSFIRSKQHIRHFDSIALYLLSTAILSFNVAFIPEGIFATSTEDNTETAANVRRPKKKKA